jgi:Ca2+-transporting ATPase
MKHHRQSMFAMNLLANKPLFISVVGGCLALFPTIYIPDLNTLVFRMEAITWEWGLCAASIVLYVLGAEGYKAFKRRIFRRVGGSVGGKLSPGTELSRNTTVETLK